MGMSHCNSVGLVPFADSQPDDHRRPCRVKTTLREIFVFGDNRRTVLDGVFLNDGILGVAKSNLSNGDGIASGLPQLLRQNRRKLRVNDELHATWNTA
jgi:hypothetical protein